MDNFNYYYYYLSSLFAGFPMVVKIALALVLIMGLLYLASWVRIGFLAYVNKRDEKRNKGAKKYREKLFSILKDPQNIQEDTVLSLMEITPPIKDWMKAQFSEYIVDSMDEPGINLTNMGTILRALRIPEYWKSELDSGNISKKWKSIRMLDSISPYVASSIISKKANSEKKDLGNYAKSVFAKFDSHDAFKFLEDASGNQFTQLDKMRIHNSLKQRPPQEVLPHLINTAINTDDDEYRIFLIREVGLTGISEGVEPLVDLYKESKNPEIRAQIVQTLSLLNYRAAIPVFIKDYHFSKLQVQEEIIEGLGCMGGPESLEFLEKIYSQTNNKELLVKILRNIYTIEANSANPTIFKKLQTENKGDFDQKAFTYIESQYN